MKPSISDSRLCATFLVRAIGRSLATESASDTSSLKQDIATLLKGCEMGEVAVNEAAWPELVERIHLLLDDDELLFRFLNEGRDLAAKYPSIVREWFERTPMSLFPPAERMKLTLSLLPPLGTDEWLKEVLLHTQRQVDTDPRFSSWRRPPPKGEPASSCCLLTRSQSAAFEKMVLLARTYFSGERGGLQFVPRFNALLAGPTGSGKSFLAEKLAKHLGVGFFAVSCNEWLVQGVRHHTPTLVEILNLVLENPNGVIVFLDELDKFSPPFDGAWARSNANEIWSCLDRRLPLIDFCRQKSVLDKLPALTERVQKKLFFVAAGTWQSLFDRSRKRSLGFHASDTATTATMSAAIRADSGIPAELLSRCSGAPVILEYPGLEETGAMLRRLGIEALATSLNRKIEPEEIDWHSSGWRALERVAAELLIEHAQRSNDNAVEIAAA